MHSDATAAEILEILSALTAQYEALDRARWPQIAAGLLADIQAWEDAYRALP